MGACTAYTNVFLKCWVSAFCTIMEMCFATFDGFQKLLPFQHVVPTSSSHMKSCNFYLLSFSVSCMSRTFFNPFWLWPSMAIYGPYKLGIHREQYVGNLVGLISQFFCMELRGPRRSLTGQETPTILTRTSAEPAWSPPQSVSTFSGTFPQLPQPFSNFQSNLPVRNLSRTLAELPTRTLQNAAGNCPQLLAETRYRLHFAVRED